MNILADAALPGLDLAFPKPFNLTMFHHIDDVSDLLLNQQILLCRSTLKVNQVLLKNHSLKIVATATSGDDHLDKPFLNSRGTQVLDAKGCNAISVADYVVSCLAYLKKYNGQSVLTAGIIGMGHVGTKVYQRLNALGIQVVCYDPLKQEPYFKSDTKEQLFNCDLLCIHAEWHNTPPHPSAGLIDETFLARLKKDCIIINASRGGILVEEALLSSPQDIIYCTDVFANEPKINAKIVEQALLCTPHIAGHSLEAKFAAVASVSDKIHSLLKLSKPLYAKPTKPFPRVWDTESSWDDQVLSLYNPMMETIKMKESSGNVLAFLDLRKHHQFRHDFAVYFDDKASIGAMIR